MNRRSIRRAAMCLVFENEFANDPDFAALHSFADEIADGFSIEELETVRAISHGVLEHKEELDQAIAMYLRDWSITRLPKLDLAILRLALYEIIYEKLPFKVSINEAVELSKRYSDEKSPSFINGVLGGYVKANGL